MIDYIDVPATLRTAGLVVFDLDGTLYDDHAYLAAADAALENFLVEDHAVQRADAHRVIRESVHPVRTGFLDRICRGLDMPVDIVPRMVDVIRSARAPIQLHAWVAPLLECLNRRGTQIWVLTNGNIPQQKNKLALLRMGDASYGVRVAFAENHRSKPAPDGLRHILSVSKLPAEKAVMIGDSEADRLCAESCKVPFISVNDLADLVDRLGLDRVTLRDTVPSPIRQ